MSTKILDPTKLDLKILGCKVEGFSSGSFVTISKESPTFSTKTSIKGRKCVNRNKHKDYTLTFRLENNAGANTWLHSIYKLQEEYGVVFPVPIFYKDLNGTTSFYCISGILEEPSIEQGNTINPTQWTILCPKAIHVIGASGEEESIAKSLRVITTVLSAAEMFGLDVTGLRQNAQNLIDKAGGLF